MIFKANLHFHAHNDELAASYDIYKYIDCAEERGFDVLAYTPHGKFLYEEEYGRYAENKGILLIPGIEIRINKKHIVVLNCGKETENIKTFEELRNYKNKNPQIFILAPHPFLWSRKSLFSNLIRNIDLFDAVEMTVFSNWLFNFNKRAKKVAEKYNKPLVATSDTHFLKDMERGYALIEADNKTARDIFVAIKKNKFQDELNSMGLFAMAVHVFKLIAFPFLDIINEKFLNFRQA